MTMHKGKKRRGKSRLGGRSARPRRWLAGVAPAGDTAAARAEARLAAVLEGTADWIWETDAELRYTYYSPTVESALGIPVEQMVGRRVGEIGVVESDPADWQRFLADMAAHRPVRDFVFSKRFDNGRIRWIRLNATPLHDAAGRFTGYRAVARDITAERESVAAERALRRYHAALEQLRHPVVLFDPQDRLLAFNRAFADMHCGADGNCVLKLGMSYAELAAWRLANAFYAPAANGGDGDLATLMERKRRTADFTVRIGDGRWMLVEGQAFDDGSSAWTWTDISPIKLAEEQRQEARRSEALGTLAGGIAHELNNALVPVMALAKTTMSRLPEASRERRNLMTIAQAAEKARDLVARIVVFSRKDLPAAVEVDMAALAGDALVLLRRTLRPAVTLEARIEPVPPVLGDPEQLPKIIVNLVANAAAASKEHNGTVTVEVAPAPGERLLQRPDRFAGTAIRLSVIDQGSGMDEATRARIFEPFFTTRTVGQGTGLGLSVVHGIVKQHGGQIAVDSAPGRGTRFDVYLPAATGGDG